MSKKPQKEISSSFELQPKKRQDTLALDSLVVSQENADDGLFWSPYISLSQRQILQSNI